MEFRYFYKKVKYEIEYTSGVKKSREVVYSGQGKELQIKDTIVYPLENTVFLEEIWNRSFKLYKSKLYEMLEMAIDGWKFDVYFVLKVNQFESKNHFYNFVIFIEIFKSSVSYDFIMLDNEDKWRDIIYHLQENERQTSQLGLNKELDLKKDILIRGQAASVLSHELFGHLFEIDNFFVYGYENYLPQIEKLGISISDMPRIKNSPAYHLVDDFGINSRNIVICYKGQMTGNVIGGNINQRIVSHALRRNNYEEICIPRMSNLSINYEGNNIRTSTNYIEIIKMGKCFFHHKKKCLEFSVDVAYIYSKEILCKRISNFKFSIELFELLKKLVPINTKTVIRPLQCQKRGQVIDCGICSNDWLLQEGIRLYDVF